MNWAYIVQCADGSLYAGWTNALAARISAHSAGTGAKYTRGRGPVRLWWAKAFETKSEAMREEARVKRLSRAQKLALCAQLSEEGLAALLAQDIAAQGKVAQDQTAQNTVAEGGKE